MSTLGFDSYVEPLKLYLQKFREVSKVSPIMLLRKLRYTIPFNFLNMWIISQKYVITYIIELT